MKAERLIYRHYFNERQRKKLFTGRGGRSAGWGWSGMCPKTSRS